MFVEVTRDQSGFGFSIQGGAEYEAPLFVLKIAPGGAAEKDGKLRVSVGLRGMRGDEGGRVMRKLLKQTLRGGEVHPCVCVSVCLCVLMYIGD